MGFRRGPDITRIPGNHNWMRGTAFQVVQNIQIRRREVKAFPEVISPSVTVLLEFHVWPSAFIVEEMARTPG